MRVIFFCRRSVIKQLADKLALMGCISTLFIQLVLATILFESGIDTSG